MLNLTTYKVQLKVDPSVSWTITAKTPRQAKDKALYRIRTMGSSTIRLSDLYVQPMQEWTP